MNSPERSFGSNQVLLGGMIWPASAMSMSCDTVTGNSENATPPRASTRLHQFLRSADPADEFDALAGAGIVDAEDGREQPVLQHAHVEPRHRIGRGIGRAAQPLPPAAEIHADPAGGGG